MEFEITVARIRAALRMLKIKEVLQKVMVLMLLSYFLWRVWQSGQKLFDGKIGNSVSKKFSEYRLYPSLSICFFMKNITQKSFLEGFDGYYLQRALDDVLLGFAHRNVSEKSHFSRKKYFMNKSALSAHVSSKRELCIAYHPQGPTPKSWNGVSKDSLPPYVNNC